MAWGLLLYETRVQTKGGKRDADTREETDSRSKETGACRICPSLTNENARQSYGGKCLLAYSMNNAEGTRS